MPLYVKTKEKFEEDALELIRKALLKNNLVLSDLEEFRKPINKIGKMYYDLKKAEEL